MSEVPLLSQVLYLACRAPSPPLFDFPVIHHRWCQLWLYTHMVCQVRNSPSPLQTALPIAPAAFASPMPRAGYPETGTCADKGPYASYPKYSRANSYPWSPFPSRRVRPGPGPHREHGVLSSDYGKKSRPDSGLSSQVQVLQTFQVVFSSLGSSVGSA